MPRAAWLTGLVVAALCAAGCGDVDRETASYGASVFPSGEPASVDDLRGDAVLLAGWATWCLPCERELPELDAFAAGADGIRVVAVNVDTGAVDVATIAAMLDRLGISLPTWRDPDAELLAAFDGSAMPFAVLLDRNGEVVRTWNGAIDVDAAAFRDAVATASLTP